MGECYVCTDTSYTLSPCKCKNLYLHQDCYDKLLAYNNKHCGVCLEPFPFPEVEAPDIYINIHETETKVHISCIPIVVGRTSSGIIDSIMEPLRHTLYIFLLFNLLKFIIFPSNYTIAFALKTSDILISFLTIFIYGSFILAVRGTYIRNNNH